MIFSENRSHFSLRGPSVRDHAPTAHAALVVLSARRARICDSAVRTGRYLSSWCHARSRRAARLRCRQAHRFQHMARPDLSRRAGGTRRKRDAGKIEADLRRLGLQARNSEECRVGKALRASSKNFCVGRQRQDRLLRCGRASRQSRAACDSVSRATRAAAPKPAIPARFSVPARWPFSWPPPVISGIGIIRSDAATSAPTPDRTADLVRGQDQVVRRAV